MFEEFNYTCNVTPATLPGLEGLITTSPSAYDACAGAHAIAVMTEWSMFKELDYNKIYAAMSKPAFIFDGRNILPHDKLREIGFEVYAIGKPQPQPAI